MEQALAIMNLLPKYLWMGTHPSGPSILASDGETYLSKYVLEHPVCLGRESVHRFGKTLPFLFKILSVRKALSIQAHPTKDHAEELNRQRPDLYKDSNHKPELAIALTPFEALLAFRPALEIASFVQALPELQEIVGQDCLSDLIAVSNPSGEQEEISSVAIKAAYTKLMLSDAQKVSNLVNQLRTRLSKNASELQLSLPTNYPMDVPAVVDVFLRLSDAYPGDVGCFSLFFLNYIKLNPGEAVYLEPNLPHAYLYGDCVECMACSDNVVRAGLTPKFKDVECLLGMLQYEPRSIDDLVFPPKPRQIEGLADEHSPKPEIVSFSPPVEDFAVDKILIPNTIQALELLPVASASILLCVRGSGFIQQLSPTPAPPSNVTPSGLPGEVAARIQNILSFKRGSVIFIGADVACCIHQCVKSLDQQENDDDTLLAFRAYANVDRSEPRISNPLEKDPLD